MKWTFFALAFLLWVAVMYFGMITMVQKSMHNDTPTNSLQSQKIMKTSPLQAQEVAERHKRLLEDRKSRLRDLRR